MLTVDSLSTGYGDLEVVHDVSLHVEAGTLTAVLGRNGVGKTTTLRAITGLNPVRQGSVVLNGQRIHHLPAHRRVALGLSFMQEGKRIFGRRTVEENLVIGAIPAKLDKQELVARLATAYERFPILGERCKARAVTLSGGQQQMLALSQALMIEPKVLLLDEPSGGLAPSIVGDILNAVRALTSSGMAVVLVEQSVNFALAVADSVVLVDRGRVVWSGPSDSRELDRAIHDAYFSAVRAAAETPPPFRLPDGKPFGPTHAGSNGI